MESNFLRLSLPRNSSETDSAFRERQRNFTHALNGTLHRPESPQKRFADLLKRQARRIMSDVTECQPHLLPVNLSRLDDLRQIIESALAKEFVPTYESLPSGAALQYPTTLNDFLAAMEITRRQHRAPSFINSRDAEIAEIHRKIDTIAGLLAAHPLIEEITELSGKAVGL